MRNAWRSTTWKMLAVLALMGGLLLVIVACGGDEEEATPAPAPAAAPVDVTAMANQMASRLEQTMLDAMAQMQPPLSEDQIRSLIEAAVSENAPEGISSAQIRAMVDSAVTAAAAEGVNQEDVTAAIGAALAEAAAAQAEPLEPGRSGTDRAGGGCYARAHTRAYGDGDGGAYANSCGDHGSRAGGVEDLHSHASNGDSGYPAT